MNKPKTSMILSSFIYQAYRSFIINKDISLQVFRCVIKKLYILGFILVTSIRGDQYVIECGPF